MSSNDDQGDMEEQPTHSQFWPHILLTIGLILLFLAFGECYSHFSFDGGNNPESNYTTQFCYSGLFFMFIATILSTSIDSKKEKARKEKMTEEEKKLEIAKKKKEDKEKGIAILILILTVVLFLIITGGSI
jgi:hypothetical protein